MQVHRRFSDTNDEQQEKAYAATRASARTSVWIDPVERHNVSASYVERERVGQKRRREEVSNSIPPIPPIPLIPPIPPISSTRIPRRASVHVSHPSGSLRARSRLHPESTVSGAKNASLSPHSAIDELDTVPPAISVARVEQAIDEIDTILPISPSIDEIDTIPEIRRQLDKAVVHTDKHPVVSRKQNEVDIDEIDTLIPPTPVASFPKPVRQAQVVHTIQASHVEKRVTPDDKMLPVVQRSPVSREVPWTAGQGANSELAKRIASRARDKQEKPLGELILAPLNKLRWWLLYPGRMEFMLWISGALILLCVTCTLLFATLASSGIIRFAGADTSTERHIIHNAGSSLPCAASSPQCHNTKTTSATSTTNKQGSSSTLQTTKTTSVTATAATTSTPGASTSPISGGSGTSTPISQTPPVSVSPTVSASPTVEPTRTSPTPTATVKPSPTSAITPTVGATPPKPTPTAVHHTDAQTLSLGTAFADNAPSQGATTSTWMWLALIGYALSMGMLGLAALLYRRKRRLS